MNESDLSITRLISELKCGDQDAALDLWKHYFRRLIALARQKLRHTPLQVKSEEDVVVDAFDSLCRGAAEGRFERLDNRNDLWQILVAITVRKAINQRKWVLAAKRGAKNVKDEAFFVDSPLTDAEHTGLEKFLREGPTSGLLEDLSDECRELLSLLDEDLKEVAMLRFSGFTNQQIAEKTGRLLSWVERQFSRIRQRWRSRQISIQGRPR